MNAQISKSGLNRGTIFNAWNTHSYSDAGANMNNFPSYAQSSSYDISQKYTKACYNENVDSCNPRFNPRPKECTLRLYNSMGGKAAGKLYPKNEDKWPTTWVPAFWKQEGTWSTGKYQDEIATTRQTAGVSKAMLRQKPRTYDTAAKTNMQIYGNKPAPPFAKPCWGDMLDMAKSLESAGVTVCSKKDCIEYNNARQFNILPNTNDMNRITNGDLNVYNYRLYKETFENPNFPYWDAVWKYEDYWRANWNKFKGILSSVRGVISDNNMIGLSKNIIMSSFITGAKAAADNNNVTYNCSTGSSYNTYNYNTLTPGQKQKAIELWGEVNGKNPRYFACAQGCRGHCSDRNGISALAGDNEYVYITKDSYNKEGFPYALLVNMSQ